MVPRVIANVSKISREVFSYRMLNTTVPTKDTAGDIVELRMLSKGNVSQAVDLLCQKGLLSKTADQTDRRKTHLSLLPSCENVTEAIDTFQSAFYHNLFDGFSLEEFQMFASLNERLASNVATIYHKGDY